MNSNSDEIDPLEALSIMNETSGKVSQLRVRKHNDKHINA